MYPTYYDEDPMYLLRDTTPRSWVSTGVGNLWRSDEPRGLATYPTILFIDKGLFTAIFILS